MTGPVDDAIDDGVFVPIHRAVNPATSWEVREAVSDVYWGVGDMLPSEVIHGAIADQSVWGDRLMGPVGGYFSEIEQAVFGPVGVGLPLAVSMACRPVVGSAIRRPYNLAVIEAVFQQVERAVRAEIVPPGADT